MSRMMKVLLTVAVVCCLFVPALALAQEPGTSSTPPATTPVPTATPTPEQQAAAKHRAMMREKRLSEKLRTRIHHHRQWSTYWRGVMFKKSAEWEYKKLWRLHPAKLRVVLDHAKQVHHQARYRVKHPPMLWAWLCIHRHEGSWTAATGNGYYGGLQMNRVFQRMYSPKLYYSKGTANHWTKWEQIWTAVKAAFWRGRGFGPWPNTRIPCGV
jgi:hypothetical protein